MWTHWKASICGFKKKPRILPESLKVLWGAEFGKKGKAEGKFRQLRHKVEEVVTRLSEFQVILQEPSMFTSVCRSAFEESGVVQGCCDLDSCARVLVMPCSIVQHCTGP